MCEALPPSKHNSWIATAAQEVHCIQVRWKIPSRRQFSAMLHINERTLAKLNPQRPDASLQLETIDRIYSILLALLYVAFDTPEEIREEYRLLVESRIRIMNSVSPLPLAVSSIVIDEINHRQ